MYEVRSVCVGVVFTVICFFILCVVMVGKWMYWGIIEGMVEVEFLLVYDVKFVDMFGIDVL